MKQSKNRFSDEDTQWWHDLRNRPKPTCRRCVDLRIIDRDNGQKRAFTNVVNNERAARRTKARSDLLEHRASGSYVWFTIVLLR